MPQALDEFLVALAGTADAAEEFELTLTLWVGGAIVSGTLVGASVYLEGISVLLEDLDSERVLTSSFRRLSEHLQEARMDVPDGDVPAFIHLRGAHSLSPSGAAIPTGPGVWWRGRLDAVDGWCIGEFRRG
jgi:hypothetical protein